MPLWCELPRLFFLATLLLIAISDARQRRIPNLWVLCLLAFALLSLLLCDRAISGAKLEWSGIGGSALAVLLLAFPGYIGRQLGAGDIKLLLVFCVVFPLGILLLIMVLAFGGLAVACIIGRHRSLPFAPFMAAFSCMAILGSY